MERSKDVSEVRQMDGSLLIIFPGYALQIVVGRGHGPTLGRATLHIVVLLKFVVA